MSLNNKKYWLDGIFDDEEFVLPKEDLKPEVEVKSLSLPSNVVEKEIVAKWSWKEEIICRDFVYCDNAICGKRHYCSMKHKKRLESKQTALRMKSSYSWWNTKKEENETLQRVLRRLEKVEGAKIIYR
jgi:hypothetical protein